MKSLSAKVKWAIKSVLHNGWGDSTTLHLRILHNKKNKLGASLPQTLSSLEESNVFVIQQDKNSGVLDIGWDPFHNKRGKEWALDN